MEEKKERHTSSNEVNDNHDSSEEDNRHIGSRAHLLQSRHSI